MPSARNDFVYTIDRAAGLLTDATCAARTAGALPLPQPHRRLLNRAIVALERAQDDLFRVRNDPWSPPKPPRIEQLELLSPAS